MTLIIFQFRHLYKLKVDSTKICEGKEMWFPQSHMKETRSLSLHKEEKRKTKVYSGY